MLNRALIPRGGRGDGESFGCDKRPAGCFELTSRAPVRPSGLLPYVSIALRGTAHPTGQRKVIGREGGNDHLKPDRLRRNRFTAPPIPWIRLPSQAGPKSRAGLHPVRAGRFRSLPAAWKSEPDPVLSGGLLCLLPFMLQPPWSRCMIRRSCAKDDSGERWPVYRRAISACTMTIRHALIYGMSMAGATATGPFPAPPPEAPVIGFNR